jgi:putative phosphoserine phosphatase/1-acylglycerol-3-phosphate O-acyltransferase
VTGAAAIFGLERVLLTEAPEPVFARCLREAGLRGTPLSQLADWSTRLLATGTGPNVLSARTGRVVLEPGSGWSRASVRRAADAAADRLAGHLLPYGRVEIEDHKAAGLQLVLVSALPEPLVAPLAERWGFDAVVATRWERDDGSFTGRVTGPRPWGADRLRAVKEWADAHGVDLQQSYAYGGTFADAALLGACGHPRAVNPDARLAPLAAARRWSIRWFDVPPGVIKVGGRELQEWLRPLASEQFVTNAQVEISGVENIPSKGAAIVAFNHRSYFDGTVVGMLLAKAGRSARGIGKKEVFDAPLIGPFAHAFGGIRVDRGTGSDEPLFRAEKALRAGELIMIAPEGTIPRGPAFFEPELKGRWGTARLAQATNVPVIPVGLWGTEHVWPRNQRLPRFFFPSGPPKVTARVGPPVKLTYDDVDADTKRIMSAIVDQLPPEARVRRTPTEAELRRTYPANYRGAPDRELHRRPGFDR